ncbi:MAG: hypothetical protein NC299_11795 [Lachnospiraceae bacterium]|nr:hypothetical protein [Lachnospiraceae bacterium]
MSGKRQIYPGDPEVREVADMYESGMSVEEITKLTYMSRSSVTYRLHLAGVKLRRSHISNQLIARMQELRGSGLSIIAIAEKCGVSDSTVKKWTYPVANENGITINGHTPGKERRCQKS